MAQLSSPQFDKVVIIVSSGRTGTTALARHLNASYPAVHAVHEPKPSWRLRIASAKALAGRLQPKDLIPILANARRDSLAHITKPIYIESNPYLQGFIDVLGEVFDNVRVVHLVRDPRTYVRSAINFGAQTGLKWAVSTFYPYWLPKPEHRADYAGPTYSGMSPIERMAWFWKAVNQDLLRGEQIYGDNYLRLKFEDLFARDGSGLSQLTDFIGLPCSHTMAEEANRELVNASKRHLMPRWEEWDESRKQEVLKHCGDLMHRFGYDDALPSIPRPMKATA